MAAWWARAPKATLAIFLVCTLIELCLQLADRGLIDFPRLRANAYDYAGFLPGLFWGGTGNYPFQSGLMFLTYSFLHGGLGHLAINMLTLLSLGSAVSGRVGEARFLELYLAGTLGGAIAHALMSESFFPMVGSSAALFGFAGALVTWDFLERRAHDESLAPLLRILAVLVLLNILLWWWFEGRLAWQAHLGGYVTGQLLGFGFTARRRRQRA